jgi:hypothetical protein
MIRRLKRRTKTGHNRRFGGRLTFHNHLWMSIRATPEYENELRDKIRRFLITLPGATGDRE